MTDPKQKLTRDPVQKPLDPLNQLLQLASQAVKDCDKYLASLSPDDPNRESVEIVRGGFLKIIRSLDERPPNHA